MTESAFAKPKVRIITTGGTIASVNGKPMIDGPALVGALPELGNLADIEVEEFSKIGSSKMTPALWLKLSKRINQLFSADENLSSVVVTHGTDTLEETAYFLNLTVRSPKPVIIVGAMRSANEISADGPANLINAVRVGLDPKAIGSGVLVVLNERISAAREVWKTHNRGVDTFQSSSSFLGVVDPDKVRFYRSTLYAHTADSPFKIEKLDRLPKVELVMDFTDFDPAIIDYFASKGLDGLVAGSFAGGRISAGMAQGLKRAADKGLPICIASQVPEGRIIGYPAYDFPVVFAPDLSPKKARILLMLSLSLTKDIGERQGYFEQFQGSLLVFWEFIFPAAGQNGKEHSVLALRDEEAAIVDIDHAIAIQPEYVGYLVTKGFIYHEMELLEEAKVDYMAALELDPRFELTYTNLSSLLEDLGQYEAARDACLDAIQINPNFEVAYNNLGSALLYLEDYQAARPALEKAIELLPSYIAPHYNLGNLYRFTGKWKLALAAYEEVLKLDPKDRDAIYQRDRMLEKLKKD